MPKYFTLKIILSIMIALIIGNPVLADKKIYSEGYTETTGVLGANESLNSETISPISETETTGIMGANESLNFDNKQAKDSSIIGDTETTGIMGINEKLGSKNPSIIGDIETTGTPASNQVLLFETLTKETLDNKEYADLENKINSYLEKID